MKRATRDAQRLITCFAVFATACSDALDQDTAAGQVVAVLAATSGDVTLVDVVRLETTSFALAAGVPTSLAARGQDIVVTLGDSMQLASTMGAGTAGAAIPLADGSGATGVAIEDDSIAWIANPNLNTVTRVNYLTGDTASFVAGPNPQAVAVTESHVFVLNGNVSGGQPAGPSSIRWFTRTSPIVATQSFGLSCTNARFAAQGADGLLYVVCSGSTGGGDGKLAIVDPLERTEVAVLNGLGELPGPAVYHPSGRLIIASAVEGIIEVNTATRTVVRGPGVGVKPEGDGIGALVVDRRGRIYAVAPRGCAGPGVVHVLNAPPSYGVIETVPVGVCPVAAVLAGGN